MAVPCSERGRLRRHRIGWYRDGQSCVGAVVFEMLVKHASVERPRGRKEGRARHAEEGPGPRRTDTGGLRDSRTVFKSMD